MTVPHGGGPRDVGARALGLARQDGNVPERAWRRPRLVRRDGRTPGREAEIVVSVLLEFGEHGWVAAQYAAKTADYYLRRKYGMPTDTVRH